MRLVSLLIILSVMIGCKTKEKPDAYMGTLVILDVNGNVSENAFAFMVNSKTGQEMAVPIKETHKWIVIDPTSYETYRNWYKKACR